MKLQKIKVLLHKSIFLFRYVFLCDQVKNDIRFVNCRIPCCRLNFLSDYGFQMGDIYRFNF